MYFRFLRISVLIYKRQQASISCKQKRTLGLGASISKLKMITPVVYVFLVHVIVCTTAEGRDAGNQTRTLLLSSQNDTHRMNVFASNKTNKECRLTVNETDLSSLQQLARSKVVHVVQLDLRFSSNISNSMIKEWRWRLTNNVGKEILSVLAMKETYVTWTLEVGRKTAKVRVIDDPPGCATSEKEAGDFIAGTILKQLSFVHGKEICFDKVSNSSTQTSCCRISIGNGPLKYQCYVSLAGSEFVNVLESMLSFYIEFAAYCGLTVFVYFGIFLQMKNANNTKGYYKLTESPMSISSILYMLFWDGYGKFKSFARRCLLIVVVLLILRPATVFSAVYLVLLFLLWAILCSFSKVLQFVDNSYYEVRTHHFWSGLLLKIFSYLGHDVNDVCLSARENLLGAIGLITLPFNIKRWKILLVRFYDKFIKPRTLGSSLKDKVLLFSKTVVFCLLNFVFVFMLQVVFVLLLIMECYCFVVLRRMARILYSRDQRRRHWTRVLAICLYEGICLGLTIKVFFIPLIYMPFIIISSVSGLVLNVVYFFPYVVSISVLTFYSWLFWTSVEQQYVVLMRLIFDNNINNNDDHNDGYGNNSNGNNNDNGNNNSNDNSSNNNSNNNSNENSSNENSSNENSNNHNNNSNDNSNDNDNSNNNNSNNNSNENSSNSNNHNSNNSNSNDNSNNNNNNNNSNENSSNNNSNNNSNNHNNNNNNNNSNNDNVGRDHRTHNNTEIVCVVSKELYDNIRERLLPYHGNLFRFVMNVFWICIFSYIILTLVRVLQTNDVSPTVQLLTTLSVSAVPYIMNTVAGKKGEEQKDAEKEQLKHSVKPLVDTLTADNPDLRRTQLIIQHEVVDPDRDEPFYFYNEF